LKPDKFHLLTRNLRKHKNTRFVLYMAYSYMPVSQSPLSYNDPRAFTIYEEPELDWAGQVSASNYAYEEEASLAAEIFEEASIGTNIAAAASEGAVVASAAVEGALALSATAVGFGLGAVALVGFAGYEFYEWLSKPNNLNQLPEHLMPAVGPVAAASLDASVGFVEPAFLLRRSRKRRRR
jgi:hypothetical protein